MAKACAHPPQCGSDGQSCCHPDCRWSDERETLEHRAEYLQREINEMRRAMQRAGTWDAFCADYAAYRRERGR